MTILEILHKSGRNVFTTDDLVVMWDVSDRRDIIESIKDYIRRNRLYSPHRGVYTLNKEYESYELAQKLILPSYISYYTALARHGLIFQQYKEIHSFASYTKTITVDDQTYVYHKCKDVVLMNGIGIVQESNYSIASAERAVCDSLYLNRRAGFDNISNINSETLRKLARIYKNQRLQNDIDDLIKSMGKG